MVDINMVEELIADLKAEYIPANMSELLASDAFERGRIAMVYDIIDRYERLMVKNEDDLDVGLDK